MEFGGQPCEVGHRLAVGGEERRPGVRPRERVRDLGVDDAADGNGAARIEEEVVVTPDGCRVITLFPSKELFIANEY